MLLAEPLIRTPTKLRKPWSLKFCDRLLHRETYSGWIVNRTRFGRRRGQYCVLEKVDQASKLPFHILRRLLGELGELAIHSAKHEPPRINAMLDSPDGGYPQNVA